MNFFLDFAPNSRKEWGLSLFNQFCENEFENDLNFWKFWKSFNFLQFYSIVSLLAAAAARLARRLYGRDRNFKTTTPNQGSRARQTIQQTCRGLFSVLTYSVDASQRSRNFVVFWISEFRDVWRESYYHSQISEMSDSICWNLAECIEFVPKIRSKILTIQWFSRLIHEQASRPPPQAPEWSRETWNGAETAPAWDTEEVRSIGQTLQGSFSAVSKTNFAIKYAFESSRRDLHNALLCTALKTHFFLKFASFFKKKFANFAEFCRFIFLTKCFQTHILLQNLASMQTRTSLSKLNS